MTGTRSRDAGALRARRPRARDRADADRLRGRAAARQRWPPPRRAEAPVMALLDAQKHRRRPRGACSGRVDGRRGGAIDSLNRRRPAGGSARRLRGLASRSSSSRRRDVAAVTLVSAIEHACAKSAARRSSRAGSRGRAGRPPLSAPSATSRRASPAARSATPREGLVHRASPRIRGRKNFLSPATKRSAASSPLGVRHRSVIRSATTPTRSHGATDHGCSPLGRRDVAYRSRVGAMDGDASRARAPTETRRTAFAGAAPWNSNVRQRRTVAPAPQRATSRTVGRRCGGAAAATSCRRRMRSADAGPTSGQTCGEENMKGLLEATARPGMPRQRQPRRRRAWQRALRASWSWIAARLSVAEIAGRSCSSALQVDKHQLGAWAITLGGAEPARACRQRRRRPYAPPPSEHGRAVNSSSAFGRRRRRIISSRENARSGSATVLRKRESGIYLCACHEARIPEGSLLSA